MEDSKKRDWFNVLDKNGRREITMAEQTTWGWDALAAKEMINIDLIHPQTVKWDINKDEKLATVKLHRDAG